MVASNSENLGSVRYKPSSEMLRPREHPMTTISFEWLP